MQPVQLPVDPDSGLIKMNYCPLLNLLLDRPLKALRLLIAFLQDRFYRPRIDPVTLGIFKTRADLFHRHLSTVPRYP